MTEQVTQEELAEHMARIKEDPAAWAFCLGSGVMQWMANFGMMSAKRRSLRGWVVAVQGAVLTGLLELAKEPAAGRWRAHFAEADRLLGEFRLDDAQIREALGALQNQLAQARAVVL